MDLLDVLAKMKEEPSSRATCERWVKNNPSAELGFENNDLVIFIGDFRPRKFTIAYDELMFTDWRILPQPQQKSLGRIACDTFYDGCTDEFWADEHQVSWGRVAEAVSNAIKEREGADRA